MNKILNYIIFWGLLLFTACSDPWETRFEQDSVPTQTVWEILSETSDYSSFVNFLRETEYDSVLQRNTSFTVFAVANQSMPDLSAYSEEEKMALAAYHLSNYVIFTDGMAQNASLKTLNGKQYFFSIQANQVVVNNQYQIVTPNIQATNGVIHELNALQQTQPNILEYIVGQDDYSYVADFFNEGTSLVFDLDNSTPIGINEDGQTVYDSIWKRTNDFLSNVADLDSEDKQFTMFLSSNTMLDTASDGNYKFGYLSNVGSFIIDRIIDESELPGTFTTVNGFTLTINDGNYFLLSKLSNGWVYSLKSFEGIRIPKKVVWEITDVSDFDSVRLVKTAEYATIYDQFKDLIISDLNGGFVNFKYDLLAGPLNGDYLKIVTQSKTTVKIGIKLPDLLPGKYAIKLSGQLRAVDAIAFDAYMNGEKIGSNLNLNGGSYNWGAVELGSYIVDTEQGNVLTISILGANSSQTKGYLDHLIFEPVN